MEGVGLRDVHELKGDATIAMICRYSHLAPQHFLDAFIRLDGWGSMRTGTKTGTDTSAASSRASTNYQQVVVQ